MNSFEWFCPAVEKMIDAGLCWEYVFANGGGPTDTANELKEWIKTNDKFSSLKEFHLVCKKCEHNK